MLALSLSIFSLKVPLVERAITKKVILGLVLGVGALGGLVLRSERHLFFPVSMLQLGLEPNSQAGRAGKRKIWMATWELHGTLGLLALMFLLLGGRLLGLLS